MKLIHFEKKLGVAGAVSITVGAVIGVGIFVIVGEIGGMAGSWTSLAFLLAGAGAVFGTMVAVALGSTIPADGGGFFYTKSLLGRPAGIVASWLIVVGALGSIGTVSLGVADYIGYYFPVSSLPPYLRVLIAALLILLTWGINALGIMASEKLQIGMVVQLASALLILVVIAIMFGNAPDFSQNQPAGTGTFLMAGAMAMLSYTGFNIIGELGDELENPRRNVPLTIIIGLGIIIFIYVGIGWIVSGTLVTAKAMAGSRAALLDTAMQFVGEHKWFMHYLNLAAVLGAVTSINAVFLAVPREFSAQADDGILPRWIMKFNAKRQTFPVGMGIVAVAGIIICLFNFKVGTYGYMCVAGLLLANVLFSVGALRMFKLFPDKIATAPLPIRKWWLYPAAAISSLLSLGFGGLATYGFVESIYKQLLS
ncbi:MAG TPA: APC family permease [bacterium]|nr:APC family permease [bacterium]